MADKFGPYITKLMTTVKDFKEDEFVRNLAIDELKRLNVNIEEFVRTNNILNQEEKEKIEKQLLQEDKKNVKNK
tara:strand:+ start:264 stop:485 length:222 start_codon:yes stop_codon:yes gene_type:complete